MTLASVQTIDNTQRQKAVVESCDRNGSPLSAGKHPIYTADKKMFFSKSNFLSKPLKGTGFPQQAASEMMQCCFIPPATENATPKIVRRKITWKRGTRKMY